MDAEALFDSGACTCVWKVDGDRSVVIEPDPDCAAHAVLRERDDWRAAALALKDADDAEIEARTNYRCRGDKDSETELVAATAKRHEELARVRALKEGEHRG